MDWPSILLGAGGGSVVLAVAKAWAVFRRANDGSAEAQHRITREDRTDALEAMGRQVELLEKKLAKADERLSKLSNDHMECVASEMALRKQNQDQEARIIRLEAEVQQLRGV